MVLMAVWLGASPVNLPLNSLEPPQAVMTTGFFELMVTAPVASSQLKTPVKVRVAVQRASLPFELSG
jgi:hypothetical protein